MMPSLDLGQDGLGLDRPDERFGCLVVLGEVAVDRGLQVDERMEHAALQAPSGQLGEEAVDGVEPRGGGGREVEGPAVVALEPGADLGMLVGGVVVEDHMDQLAGRDVALETVEEAPYKILVV